MAASFTEILGTMGSFFLQQFYEVVVNNLQNDQSPSFDIPENSTLMDINDQIGGFSNKRFYDELGANNIGEFIENVRINQLPATGNTVGHYNTLWQAYGY